MNTMMLHKITYGVYIVSSFDEGKNNGQIANTVFQITSKPPTIAVSINKQNLTHRFIEKSKVFCVSVLSVDADMKFIGRFGFKSGRDFDKFADVKYKQGITGAPIVLQNAIAYLEAELVDSIDVGTHTIFIGKIVDADILSNAEPMTYAYYHKIKGGKSPKTAPTYIEQSEIRKEKSKMKKFRCKICGYVYDPEKGDPDNGIEPGTPFEKIPNDWVCPVCGATKDQFEEV